MRLALLPLLAALMLPGMSCASEHAAAFNLIHVPDLVALQQQPGSRVQVYDANGPEFRAANGVIPGAKLLSSFNHYDVDRELPKDRATPLVFYCANSL